MTNNYHLRTINVLSPEIINIGAFRTNNLWAETGLSKIAPLYNIASTTVVTREHGKTRCASTHREMNWANKRIDIEPLKYQFLTIFLLL